MKNGVKNIQAAVYNGAQTVFKTEKRNSEFVDSGLVVGMWLTRH